MFVSGKHSWATVCANSTGVAEDEHYDLQMSLIAPITSQARLLFYRKIRLGRCVSNLSTRHAGELYIRSYVTNFIVQETIDNYKYMH